jgi:uncharacterized protein YkwD
MQATSPASMPRCLGSQHLSVAVLLLLVATACGGAQSRTSGPVPLPTGSVGPQVDPTALGAAIHARINAIRAEHGLMKLSWNPALVAPATAHSRDMAARNYFSHHSPDGKGFADRYEAAGFRCRVLIEANRYATGGENLALSHLYDAIRSYSDGRREVVGWRSVSALAQRIVDGWMNSPGHRRNILKPFWRSEAIGVVVDRSGQVFATQNFC